MQAGIEDSPVMQERRKTSDRSQAKTAEQGKRVFVLYGKPRKAHSVTRRACLLASSAAALESWTHGVSRLAPVLGGGGRRWRAIGAMAPVTHHAPLWDALKVAAPGRAGRLGAAWVPPLEAPSPPAGCARQNPHTTGGRHVHRLILAICLGMARTPFCKFQVVI